MGGRAKATEFSQMSIMAHLKELRGHLFLVAIVFVIFSALGYGYRDEVLAFLLAPLDGQKLSYLTPGGGFSFIFKISMWCGIAAAVPMLLFALYRFVSPALPEKAQSKSIIVLVVAQILMICGFAFGYIYAIPGAIRFLLGFADQYVQSMLTADSYLDFILAYTVGLGVLFQIPLILVVVNWIKPLKPLKLLSFERYVVLVAFILAALITPTPDVVNQCVIALPIVIMYQLGVLAVAWVNWREKRHEKKLNRPTKQMRRTEPVQHAKPIQPKLAHGLDLTQPVATVTQSPVARTQQSHPIRQVSHGAPMRRSGVHSIDGMRPMVRKPLPTQAVKPIVRSATTSMQIPSRAISSGRSIDGVIISRSRPALA